MRAIIWAAVSTPEQATEEKDSIPSQIADAERLIRERNWTHTETLVVPGESRSRHIEFSKAAQDIQTYARLKELIDAKSFDILIVRARDRLARLDCLCAQIEQMLRDIGAQVYSMSFPTPIVEDIRGDRSSLITAAIERAMGQSELVELRRRHDSGMRSRITKRGLHPSHPPYGYRKISKDEPFTQIPDEVRVLRQIYTLYIKGWGLSRIVAWLNDQGVPPRRSPAWRSVSINRMLKNDYYAGIVRHAQLHGQGQHTPVFTPQEWSALQQERRRRQVTRGKRVSPYSGLVRCKLCNHAMRYSAVRRTLSDETERVYAYYRCSEGDDRIYEKRDGGHRLNVAVPLIRKAILEDAHELHDPAQLERACQDIALQERERLGQDKQELELKAGELSGEISRLLAAHTRWGNMAAAEFDAIMEELIQRKEEVTHALAGVTAALDTLPDPEERAKRLAEYATDVEAILNGDVQEAAAWLSQCIRVIWLGPGHEITIERV